MDKKTTSIVAYITLIGWFIALLAGDKEGAKFHLNQALVIYIFGIIAWVIGWIPIIGWIISWILRIVFIVFWILGLIAAVNQEEKEVPIIGKIRILN